MFEFTGEAKETFDIGLLGLMLTVLTSICAALLGYYSFPEEAKKNYSSLLPFVAVVFVFIIFMGVSLIIVPGVAYGWFVLIEGQALDGKSILSSPAIEGWGNIITIALTFVILVIYVALIPRDWRKAALGDRFLLSTGNTVKDFSMGFLSWPVSYPPVLAVSNLISAILIYFHGKMEIDQIAVKELKATFDQPILLLAMIVSIVFIVPVIEELLFRGFFQTWLKSKLGRFWAIPLTSALFALFHFSSTQGILNLELIPSLFVLSCYLGFLFERQRSLLAPITLHSLFNAISISMIVNQ